MNNSVVEIEILEVSGWPGAMRGMRNPKDSWERADTVFYPEIKIGPNDMQLAKTLVVGGPEHRKFARMIHVQMDLVLPRYIWSEFDTYHHNTKNSCSTMHKLLTPRPIGLGDFIYDEKDKPILEEIIKELNTLRLEYINKETPASEKKTILRRAKQILPEGFLQRRTVDTNYEELRTIYSQRRTHRLPEWQWFCDEIKKLPYFEELFLTD